MSISLEKIAYAQQITAAKVLRTGKDTFSFFHHTSTAVLGLRHICHISVKNFLLFISKYNIKLSAKHANVI